MRSVLVIAVLSGCAAPLPRSELAVREQASTADQGVRDMLLSSPRLPNGLDALRPEIVGSEGALPDIDIPGIHAVPIVRADLAGGSSPTSELTGSILRATFDDTLGQEMTDRLDEFPQSEVDANGAALFTMDELLGDGTTPGLCENPAIEFPFSENGQDYEGRMVLNRFSELSGDPYALMSTLSTKCKKGVETAGGDVDAAEASGTCTHEELLEFFQEGTDCRACAEESGDVYGCEDAGSCPSQAPTWTWVLEGEDSHKTYYPVLGWSILACAPDHYLFVDELYVPDGTGGLPGYWDESRWAYTCIPSWNADIGDVGFDCVPGSGGPTHGNSIGRGVLGYAGYLRRTGDGETPWAGRVMYVDSILTKDYIRLTDTLETSPGFGDISMRPVTDEDPWMASAWGSAKGRGWNLNPSDTRPDGASKARDFLAASLFSASTDGVDSFGHYANFDRCDADSWTDLGDGRGYCSKLQPRQDAWKNVPETSDVSSRWWSTPMLTLASSGLPDAGVPGGLALMVAGSPGLEKLDGCVYPNTFQPDVVNIENGEDGTTGSSLVGETYRFGKDDLDIVGVMGVNTARAFCPSGP